MSPRIDAVIFDVGNVLLEWAPERMYDARIGEAARKRLFAEVDLEAMNDRIDRGAEFELTVIETARAHPAWHDEIMLWHSRWIEMAQPVIPHTLRLKAALQGRGHLVFALTNFGISTWEIALREYPFLDTFDRAFVSGYLTFCKPDPRVFAWVERAAGIAPEHLLFIDDRAENIAAAAARGWQTHHFKTPEGLADRLVADGLLRREEAT